jgi:hypothetical protein
MENYKRKKDLPKETIDTFRTIEINKIKSNIATRPPRRFKGLIPILSSMMALFILGISIYLYLEEPTLNHVNLHVTKLTNQSFLVERTEDDLMTRFYYNAHIVFENEPTLLDDTFSYGFKYQYAPASLANTVDVSIDAFTLDDYRTYITVNLDGTKKTIEYVVYNSYTSVKPITIEHEGDIESIITEVFELIQMYPPIYDGLDFYDRPSYQINPAINDLENQALIDAYTDYVNNQYIDYEAIYGERLAQTATTFYDAIIVIDDTGNILSDTAHINIVDDALLDHTSYNVIHDSFDFYLNDQTNFSSKSTINFNRVTESVTGKVVDFKFNDMRYFYTFISLEDSLVDLSQATKVTYTYLLSYSIDPSSTTFESTHDLLIYEDYLLVPPIHVATEPGNITAGLFRDLIITFYDEDDNIVFEIDLHPYN